MGEFIDKTKGKFHEIKGSVTGDRSEQAKGIAQQKKGDVEGNWDRMKENAKETFGTDRDPNLNR